MRQIDMKEVREAGDFSKPAAGPYICKITAVEDIEDREYLKITYDIDQGEFKGYYTEAREAHPDWLWMGAYARSYKPTALGMFKRFCTAVSKSNGNFVFDAGDVNSDETTLIGKKVGIVFQEEEYYSNSGDKRTRLIVNHEFPVDKLEEQKTPEPKRLPEARPASDFKSLDVPAGTDEEIPF